MATAEAATDVERNAEFIVQPSSHFQVILPDVDYEAEKTLTVSPA